MPTILRIEGCRFFFFSNEGKEPPHIHVESAEKYAEFWICPVVFARSIGFNAPEINSLRHMIEEHEDLFKEKWDEYFKG